MIIPLYSPYAAGARAVYAVVALCVILFVVLQIRPDLYYSWSLIPAEFTSGRDLVNDDPLSPRPDHPGTSSRPLPSDYDTPSGYSESDANAAPTPAPATELSIDGSPTPDSPPRPQRPAPGSVYVTLLLKTFLHASFAHLAFNMLALWVFGGAVEAAFVRALTRRFRRHAALLGRALFVAFFVAAGAVSAVAQVYADPDALYPILGASGAVSALMGFYLVLLPRARIFAMLGIHMVTIPALTAVLFYAAFQLIFALFEGASAMRIAYPSHLAGLCVGSAMAFLFLRRGGEPPAPSSLAQTGFLRPPLVLNTSPVREVSLLGHLLAVASVAALTAASLFVAVDGAVGVGVPLVAILPVWLYLIPTLLYPAQISTLRLVLAERSLLLRRGSFLPSSSPHTSIRSLSLCVAWAGLVHLATPMLSNDGLLWLLAPLFFVTGGFLLDHLTERLLAGEPSLAQSC